MMIIKTHCNTEIIIDDEDFTLLSKYKWYLDKDGYARCYYRKNDKPTTMAMHRIVLNDPKEMIDHINHNKLDNRKINLRLCNSAQNNMNKKKLKGTSKYKGVRLYSNGKWRAQIQFNKKFYSLGYYFNEIDAALAYNNKAKEFFGEFAVLNQI
jgi:DNA-directed RNA polymerase subunit L